jgi:cell division protein FtsB
MTEPEKKQQFPSILIIGWAILCFLLAISLIKSALGVKTAFTAREKAATVLKAEEQKNKELREKIQHAQDPLTQEKMIRDELNKQKPGEMILLLPSPTP